MLKVVQKQSVNQIPREPRTPTIDYGCTYGIGTVNMNWIHPVLPGETLVSAMDTQSLEIVNLEHRSGWWQYSFLFYVPVRAYRNFSTEYETLFTDPTDEYSPGTAYAHRTGTFPDSGDWLVETAEAVMDSHFRLENERGTSLTNPEFNMRLAHKNILDSCIGGELPDQDFDVDLDADSTLMASELEQAMIRWEQMSSIGLVDIDFEDYLEANGIKQRAEEVPEAELIAYSRQWRMPTRIVDPSTGTPVFYILFDAKTNTKKRRFFKEPGFLAKFTCLMPKVYYSNMYPAANSIVKMNDFIPPHTWSRGLANYKTHAEQNGPIDFGVASGTYGYDLRDMYTHGDQFLLGGIHANADVPLHTVSLDSTLGYLNSTSRAELFTSDTIVNPISTGRASLNILTRFSDMTASTADSDPVA